MIPYGVASILRLDGARMKDAPVQLCFGQQRGVRPKGQLRLSPGTVERNEELYYRGFTPMGDSMLGRRFAGYRDPAADRFSRRYSHGGTGFESTHKPRRFSLASRSASVNSLALSYRR